MWLPKDKTHTQAFEDGASGHAAVTIAGQYLSSNSRHKSNNRNESIGEDDRYYRKYGNERVDVDLPIDQNVYSYVLKYCVDSKPSDRGIGRDAHGSTAASCFDIALLIESAVLPYLIELFSDSSKITYWLKVDGPEPEQPRYHILKKFYYKYNVWNSRGAIPPQLKYSPEENYSDEEAILHHWSGFRLYFRALVHRYGPVVASDKSRGAYQNKRPDNISWHPLRLYKYARFAQALFEERSSADLSVPLTYLEELLIADNEIQQEVGETYSFKVHVWLPSNHTKALIRKRPGHAASTIAGCYFSFSREGNKIRGRKNTWNEFQEDESYHVEKGNNRIDIELPLSKNLYPYVLDEGFVA